MYPLGMRPFREWGMTNRNDDIQRCRERDEEKRAERTILIESDLKLDSFCFISDELT